MSQTFYKQGFQEYSWNIAISSQNYIIHIALINADGILLINKMTMNEVNIYFFNNHAYKMAML